MRIQHSNPDDAVRIHQAIGARRSIGVHHSSFVMSDEPLEQPRIDLALALAEHGVDPASFTTEPLGRTVVLR